MGVRDDDVGGGYPARALDAVAAGDPADAHDARGRCEHLRVFGDIQVRFGDVGFGTLEAGDGVEPGDGLREEPRGHTLI